ncbi:translation elongation factor Ts [endosymbiont of unidentified scaly snail isolate Monju]|uniref:translation elongation factor Ts n=1 Tax=endosymbiont of unidentified scaly snail isolate Monju TaxID=1248727 RepID=UPI0005BCD890|nr:translation elongation factor Ts [endosymbiont of unidentified scaly snail isolate Monju]
MAITAALVKELRERTGAGMMECKKALVETNGDIEAAIENMRKSGQAKAAKKAGRTAAEGVIVIKTTPDNKQAAIVEVNCETDFVAKDDNFKSFADAVGERVLNSDADDVEALMALPLHEGEDTTIEEARQALVAKIGENMTVRRFARLSTDGVLACYSHGVRIGVVVDIDGDAELGRDIAMHVAASNPVCVDEADVPAEMLAKEREIVEAQARESGKPDNIIGKMIEGRMRKYLGEITLKGQPFVKDPDTTVGKLLESKGAKVNQFVRFEVGEGIEKKQEDFREEVMAQAQAARGE